MSKPTSPDLTQKPTISILDQMGPALLSATWITDADTPAVILACRLARLIDGLFDSGTNLDKLPQLVNKFEWVLRELKLTPLSRDRATGTAEEVDNSGKYADGYLRLVNTANSKPRAKRAKPRTVSK